MNFSKTGFKFSEKGKRNDRLPIESCGTLTGNYGIDFYGCWWEVKPDNGQKTCWMIGEYPDKFEEADK